MSEDDQPFGDADAEADDSVGVLQWVRDLTYREIHLAVEGLYDGYSGGEPVYDKRLQGKVTGDSWYYKALFVAGSGLDRTLRALRVKRDE